MAKKEVVVLRYGHRIVRDYRVTSHCALVARAFGAKRIIVVGEEDKEMKESIEKVVKGWGGKFGVEFAEGWRKPLTELKNKGFKAVHLTMYGLPIGKAIKGIREQGKLAVVIGSQQVERAVYGAADYNVAVGGQPHSEISALAVFLHELFKGKELGKKFAGAKKSIKPSARNKFLVNN